MNTDNLEYQIKKFIVDALELQDEVSPDDIGDDQILFGSDEGSLGLESIDALELVVVIRRDYGIEVSENVDIRSFMSVRSIAEFIRTNLSATEVSMQQE